MKLIICEKPSLAKNICDALNVKKRVKGKNNSSGYYENEEYVVTWAYGHLFVLNDVEDYIGEKKPWQDVPLPFIPEKFLYKLRDDEGIQEQFDIINNLCHQDRISEIVNCGDADQEGEVIIDLILMGAHVTKPVKRLWLPEQTAKTIRKQIKEMKNNSEYKNLYYAGKTRAYMDWLLGINLTRYLSIQLRYKYPCGRVLIPIVKFIYDRDMEIKSFVKEKYFQIESHTKKDDIEIPLILKNPRFKTKEEGLPLLNEMNNAITKVLDITKKEIIKTPQKLFSLSKLQSFLSANHGMNFNDSMQIIQSLYERKYITYPRTNSEYLAVEEQDRVKDVINVLKPNYNVSFKFSKRIFDNSKVESHSAITPTVEIPKNLNPKEQIVYNAVLFRFVANFLDEETKVSETVIKIGCLDKTFELKGTEIISMGFYQYEPKDFKNQLPNLEKDEIIQAKYELFEKETQPPKKISESDLANYLKNPFRKETDTEDDEYKAMFLGVEIGTEATRTGIIENAKRYGYISQKKQTYSIESNGITLINSLDNLKINLYKEKTVQFSMILKAIQKGEKTLDDGINITKTELYEIIDKNNTLSLGKCPRCGCDVMEGEKSFYCTGYKNGCKFTIWKENKFFTDKGKGPLTRAAVKKLLTPGARLHCVNMISKTGKKYDCDVYLDDTGEYVNFKMEFNKK